jgi:tRNA (cytidine/uridine-2'-O-)-methyltransferase
MKIVLFQPQIPQNTGNIARTCAATNTGLLLIRPLGFSISDRRMKRAGLDYWDKVQLQLSDTLDLSAPYFFFSSHAKKNYTSATYPPNSLLIFGSETDGLPPHLWQQHPDHFYTIPMVPGQRCLNLATSAAIVLYEALRQNSFCF